MSNVVKLVGAWPNNIEDELNAVLPSDVRASNQGDSSLGAVSLGDIGSLVSAAAAVISVGLTLWNARQTGKQNAAPEVDELNQDIQRKGVFGIRVEKVQPSATEPGVVRIEVADQTSGNQFRFQADISDDEVCVSIEK